MFCDARFNVIVTVDRVVVHVRCQIHRITFLQRLIFEQRNRVLPREENRPLLSLDDFPFANVDPKRI